MTPSTVDNGTTHHSCHREAIYLFSLTLQTVVESVRLRTIFFWLTHLYVYVRVRVCVCVCVCLCPYYLEVGVCCRVCHGDKMFTLSI